MTRLRRFLADTRPLRNADFRRLWQANIVTVIGAQLTVVAVPAQIFAITQSSAYVGLTGLFGLVPLVVFGLWGGALADFFDRRTMLLFTTSGLIATSLGFWLLSLSGLNNVWALLSVFALQQAFFAVNQPTRTAILPRLVPEEQLPAANSLNMTVVMAGSIAGPLVGGALIPVFGFTWLYLIDAVFLLATLYAVIKLPPLPVENRTGNPGLKAVVDGFVYLRHQPILMMSFVVDLIAMVFGMPRILFPEIAHVQFGGPTEGGLIFGLLNASIPIGAVLGGIFSGYVSRVVRHGRAVIIAIVVWGAAMAAFGVAIGFASWLLVPMLVVAVAALIVGGAADMASAAFRQSILLSAADDAVRGRLQGVFIVVVVGGPRLADVLHGWASSLVGAPIASGGGGVLVVVLTVIAAAALPAFWRYRRRESQTQDA